MTAEILRAVQQKTISLVVPVLALFESLYNWNSKRADVNERQNRMRQLANELERAPRAEKPEQHEASEWLREAALKLAPVVDEDRKAIADAINVMESCAEILQIPKGQFAEASKNEGLVTGPADALVLTAVLEHAGANPATDARFFLALDKEFSEAQVEARLKNAGIVVVKTTLALVQELRSRGLM